MSLYFIVFAIVFGLAVYDCVVFVRRNRTFAARAVFTNKLVIYGTVLFVLLISLAFIQTLSSRFADPN